MSKLNWGKRAYAVCLICAATVIALPAQTFTTLHSFEGMDGAYPYAELVQAIDGNLYGTTYQGGANGSGTVFKITPSGTLTTLYSFCSQSNCTDGRNPDAGLVQATDGNLYGTAPFGGAYDEGTVFKITPSGTLTTLYSFCSQSGCPDGYWPVTALVQGTDGNFYGTAYGGGANGWGTVFKVTPSGTLTTLHSFGLRDGEEPEAVLVQATDGSFYGTTPGGGTYGGGTVFKITPSGTLTTLWAFGSLSSKGSSPSAGLVQDTNGNFYGTTSSGGANGWGTVFKLDTTGTLTTLHGFHGADGANSYAALVQDTNGNFYGTTQGGGANGDGTVFSLSVGLGPFVETQPTFGKVGMAIKILGNHLTGATGVTFNGTPAVFKVISNSLIGAVVPVGASTGTVQVTLGNGTLSSNVPFQVKP